ncbi:ribosomal protein L3 [Treponema primitia ZAS-2]|uniref:Large ribosomal subunit protein uL3 n=1 Tax=Treponema primitia (strain ATCC BAA-887 / DSM 12427 / ZAS-2) TaxID=545694 RepID=F5YQ25_TREPZ|nr:50S ribosomal protein L3 [Treponema primitia]AEF83682.1 ribosomal protein L3 [Treponema primitia ZAS-2]
MLGLMAKKVGMTQVFDDEGNLVPVTVLRIDPNVVVARKTEEKDGYSAVLLGVDDKKKSRVTKPYAGQFSENIKPKKSIKEFRNFEKEVADGDELGIEVFEGVRYVDVTGVSKGKGMAGVIKRWGFSGGRASHGSKFHREPGSTGQSTYPGRTFKNMKLPGHMGWEQVTVLSLKLIKVDTENRLIMVRGAVPGINKGLVVVRAAVKK